MKKHRYEVAVKWTGNLGAGTDHYRSYSRNHEILAREKISIPCSSDPSFRGDPARYNPEELLVSAISSCHMLWFLHLCSVREISVIEYEDDAEGLMVEQVEGYGKFVEVKLRPRIRLSKEYDQEILRTIHDEANSKCYIAKSCNFPVTHHPSYLE
ncbi:MAG: OsmC family peroxiredoxin [Saprospiraceae bacterium]|nr:OsmC family peroxiredoxin [Saprospiraceae bacterium]